MKPGVLLVGNFLSHAGGSYQVCEALASRLVAAGWPVLTVSDQRNRVLRLADMLLTIWRRRSQYQVAQVDVFSGPSFLWAEWSARLLHRLGKPFVLTLHGGNLPSFANQHPTRARRLLNAAAKVTTPSAYLHEAMRPFCDGLVLLPNALDLARYEFRVRPAPRPTLVWLRAFGQIYNPSLAVQVLAALLKEFPQARLQMIGPDKGDGSIDSLRTETRKLRVETRVELIGGVPKHEVPAYLNRGDLFLNTSNVDNTPVSVIEAMACGLCVVSTDVGGMPYLVDHERDGLLVPPNNSLAMAKAAHRILTQPLLAERLSQNALEKARQFDWTRILPQWESLLRGVGNPVS